jgi:anti-anti-sigma factor
VLLCTDGLIERRDEVIDDGLARLADAARARATERPEMLIPAVLRRALDDEGPADDIAVIVARLRPAPLRQELPAIPAQLSAVRRAVEEWAGTAALPGDQLDDLQFTLGEALANSVEHAYRDRTPGTVDYAVSLAAGGRVHVEVSDRGSWRPPTPDPGHRGRGVEMIRALAQDVVLHGDDDGTAVRFSVAAPDASTPPPASNPRERPGRSGACLDVAITDKRELRLRLSGELDLASVASVRAPVRESARAHAGPVVLDLREVTYLGSAGAALLIDAAAVATAGVRLLTAQDGPVDRVLALAGIDSVLVAAPNNPGSISRGPRPPAPPPAAT